MSDYVEVTIRCQSAAQHDVLIAKLTGIGFEGYEEAEKILKAYIPQEGFDEALLEITTRPYNLPYSIAVIKQENWNQVWEAGFEPVIIDDFCAIRAEFHAAVQDVRHEIIITPKMSFGTGHHATTHMMIASMRKIEWKEKTVFDFGTGTGVLAILAEKLGTARITAIDNDHWSVENAHENLLVNHCVKIELYLADSLPSGQQYDVILANITKHVILTHLPSFAKHLLPDGIIIISGLLVEDEEETLKAAGHSNLKQAGLQKQKNWICMQLVHEAWNC